MHTLSEHAGIELWDLVSRFNSWLPWIDAVYGNAVYVPMAQNAKFAISVSNSGLVARPTNRAAEKAVKNWK